MAVYTHVPRAALEAFVADYDIGRLTRHEGVTQGVENTNYFIFTGRDRYVLTLFEKRVDERDLPFFMDFMAHLAARGLAAPVPIADAQGRVIKKLCDRPAVIISFLEGRGLEAPTVEDCRRAGALNARLHLYAQGFEGRRANALDLSGWRALAEKCRAEADGCAPGLAALIDDELAFLNDRWPQALPRGVVHADLFPDNVFFKDGEVSGVIDFYFACREAFSYDLAITLSAWAGEGGWSEEKARALIEGYETVRTLNDEERSALPVLLRGAALRFLLTRLHDWLHQVEGAQVAVKDPLAYRDLLEFHRSRRVALFGD